MTKRILFIALLLTAMAPALSLFGIATAQAEPRVRVVHAAADEIALDVYINGVFVASALEYGASTSPLRVSATAEFSLNLAGTGIQLLNETIDLSSDTALILTSDGSLRLDALEEDLQPLGLGLARLLVFNALEPGRPVDIVAVDASLSVEDLGASAVAGPLELDAGVLEYRIGSTDGDILGQDYSATLSAGASHILVLHGSAAMPQALVAAAAVDGASSTGALRFVHAAQGAAAFDFKSDGRVLFPSVSFGSASEAIALPAGMRQLAVSLGEIDFMTMPLDVPAGHLQTVILMGSPATLIMPAFGDSASLISEATAVVRLINTIPNSVVRHLQLDSGAIVALNVAYGKAGDAAQIVPGQHGMALVLDIGDQSGTISVPASLFHPGAYYDLIAIAGSAFSAPGLLIKENNLRRPPIAAMPTLEAARASQATDDMADDIADSDAALPTDGAESEGEQPAPEVESVAEERASAADAAETEAMAETASDEAEAESIAVSPFGIVNVNPDAGLHLRQYPTSDARSLAMLPAESEIIVLGRRGPSAHRPGEVADLPVDLSDLTVDPAAALFPAQDLNPADTWLFVTYRTADDGAINGWVNAFYLLVYDELGRPQRLASLPAIRQNQPGRAFHTSLRSPSISERVTAQVHNLDAGALLNIRIANNAGSEVLGQLAPGAILSFLGLDAEEAWMFVEQQAPSRTAIRGWVSTQYVRLLLNDEPVSVSTLRAMDATAVRLLSDSVRGGIRLTDTMTAPDESEQMDGIAGEVDLNPDAALHLRRQPSAQAESLALIPAGAMLPLKGVTASGDWFKAHYEADEGWVAAMYLVLSMDGQYFNRNYLMNQLPVHDDYVWPDG